MPSLDERIFRKKLTFAFGATDQTLSQDIAVEGEITQMHVILPEFTTAETAVLTILDEDDLKVYESNAITDNGATVIDATRYVANKQTVQLALNAAAGGTGGDATVVIYGKGIG